MALLLSLITLSLFSLLGLFMSLNAATELKISDNFESDRRARFAAQAGLDYTRQFLRDLSFDALLLGPDGVPGPVSIASSASVVRKHSYRNPIAWAAALSIDIMNPTRDRSFFLPFDDGLVNTGRYGSQTGFILIPAGGIALTAPGDPRNRSLSRYFVKASDNNGEESEVQADPPDSPFFDGDGTIIVRSMGISRTIGEMAGSVLRKNSVTVFEARFHRHRTFELDAPLVVQGNDISAVFVGNQFLVSGGQNPGIATIDTEPSDLVTPSSRILTELEPSQETCVQGLGLTPSVRDITASVAAHRDKSVLLDPSYLHSFTELSELSFADEIYQGDLVWTSANAPSLGHYDPWKSLNDPGQDPRFVVVSGDLYLAGPMEGAGVLVVHGKLSGTGSLAYNGLILVIGAGVVDATGLQLDLKGGMFVAALDDAGNEPWRFAPPSIVLSGTSTLVYNSELVEMGVRAFPPARTGWREVSPVIDP